MHWLLHYSLTFKCKNPNNPMGFEIVRIMHIVHSYVYSHGPHGIPSDCMYRKEIVL